MSNPAIIPAETAARYVDVQTVRVGDLYTAAAFGTNAARLIRDYPFTTHTFTLTCGDEVVHVTVHPTANDTGRVNYARVVAVSCEPALVCEAAADLHPEDADFMGALL